MNSPQSSPLQQPSAKDVEEEKKEVLVGRSRRRGGLFQTTDVLVRTKKRRE